MNTTIAELELKAQNHAATEFIRSHGNQSEYNRLFIDKFAESIIQECIGCLETEIERLYDIQAAIPLSELSRITQVGLTIATCYYNIGNIKHHFGINE